MGRPRTPVGTYGEIRCYPQPSGRFRAETLFRDPDGVLRPVKRNGPSEAAAKRNLKAALVERQHRVKGRLSPASTFSEVAVLWLEEVKRIRPPSTFDTYRRNLHRRVEPAFVELSMRECDDVSLVYDYLRSLEADSGLSPNMARSCRTVLSGVLGFAVRHGAIPRNPVLESGRIEGGGKSARALTDAEWLDLLAKVDADERAVQWDLPDLVRYFLATGVRLGEALGLRWCRVDLDQGVAVHGDNLINRTRLCLRCGESRPRHRDRTHCPQGDGTWTPGEGGQMLKEPKTPAGYRVLPLPGFARTMLAVRHPGVGYMAGPVFPNSIGGWRDRGNTGEEIRTFRDRAGYPWLTPHAFRKTAITILDQQGLTARAIAGYAGHARPSITMDVYMDKAQQDPGAATALDAAYRPKR